MDIRLTEAARQKIIALTGADGRAAAGLRISLQAGGCCGTFYYMCLDVPGPGDVVLVVDGARLLLDPIAARTLAGGRLDHGARLKPPRFRVRNPSAQHTCPCGRSFGAPWASRSAHCRAYELPPWEPS